jgi:hypothetical protein
MNWPVFHPDDSGKLTGLKVRRNSDGHLPVLAFAHPNYSTETLDLNIDADLDGSRIVIPAGKVILRRLPGDAGKQ